MQSWIFRQIVFICKYFKIFKKYCHEQGDKTQRKRIMPFKTKEQKGVGKTYFGPILNCVAHQNYRPLPYQRPRTPGFWRQSPFCPGFQDNHWQWHSPCSKRDQVSIQGNEPGTNRMSEISCFDINTQSLISTLVDISTTFIWNKDHLNILAKKSR